MGRHRESRTSIAVLAFIVASAVAQFNSPSDLRDECTDKYGTASTGTGRRSMGKCSSGFMQCIGGKLISRRCPGQSLFDEKIGLCVYDLDGCEMDVDIVDVTDEETTLPVTSAPLQDVPTTTGYGTQQPEQAAPSTYTQQATQETYQQLPQSANQQEYYQNGHHSQDSTQYQREYQTDYQATPTEQYQTGYQSSSQYEPIPQYGSVSSSFGDSSLPSQSLVPECDIGSFRRVSACSSSFDSCSPTARQWIRRVCGKSHRFDSSTNRCRPIFEVRECDEPMSSYIPPPVESPSSAIYSNPSTSFDYSAPAPGKEYEEKHVVDQFKGGYQTGRMESNPFIATGNTGSFYTEDGFSSIGSSWNEGGDRRRERGGRRSHKNRNGHSSGDYVIVSGNPFGGSGNKVLNDEWKGRRNERKGDVRSSLTAARGSRVRNVVDQFEGHVSHFAPPLGEVNPFAVKRADGHRRKGRKNCRRDKHRRREDWDEYECDEKREPKERPIARKLVELDDDNKDERPVQIEENTESREDSRDEEKESVEESESKELEKNEGGETDPELKPESIESEEVEETTDRVENEVEKKEDTDDNEEIEDTEELEEKDETTTNGEITDDIDAKMKAEDNGDNDVEEEEEEIEDGSVNKEVENVEERTENETEDTTENVVEDLNEDDVEKEFEENAETESTDESKTEDVELPDSIENEEDVKEEEKNGDEIESNEGISEEQEQEVEKEDDENEGGETDPELIPESIENVDVEETTDRVENEVEKKEDNEDNEVVEDTEKKEEKEENDETTTSGEISDEVDDKIEEMKTEDNGDDDDDEKIEEEEELEDPEEIEEMEETTQNEERKEEDETTTEGETEGETDPELKPESIENEEVEETNDRAENEVENGEVTDEVEDKIEEMKAEDNGDDEEEIEDGSVNREDVANVEEKAETESAVEELNEDDVDKEFDENAEADDESKTDVESPESLENEEATQAVEKQENGLPGISMQFEEEKDKTEKNEATSEETAEGELDMDPASLEGEVKEEDSIENVEQTAEGNENGEKTGDEIESNEGIDEEDDENVEEQPEESDKTEDTAENVVEDLNENEVEKEFEDDAETESTDESKTEDVELPDSIENEEKEEDVKEEEKTDEVESNEGISEEQEQEVEKEDGIEDISENENEGNRRRRSIVYDNKVYTNQSPPSSTRRLSIPRSSRLHRSRFSRLCSSSTAGQTISIGQCRQDFVYCKSARRPVVAACPVGDLFDAVTSNCVPTDFCGAEAAKMGVPSEIPVSLPSTSPSRDSEIPTMPSPTERDGEIPTMPSPTESTTTLKNIVIVDDENVDCSTLSDGAYPLSDCSSRYFVCSSSRKNSYKCPAGLVYDKPTDNCQWPADVIGCDGRVTADVTSTEKSSYSGDSIDRDIIATTVPTTVSPMHVHFECSKDGGFALDCKGGFVMCSNGIASIMRCPPALVFDEFSQACQYPAHVASCGLAPTSSPSLDVPFTPSTPSTSYPTSTSTSYPSSTLPPYMQPTSTTSSPPRAVEILVNTPVDKDACSRVSSGLEGKNEVCPSSYYICEEGHVITEMNCPEGTFFHQKTLQCDYREIACGDVVAGMERPVEHDVTETVVPTEEYSRRASRPYRPLTPLDVEKIEMKEEVIVMRNEEKPVVIPSYIESAKGSKCEWTGPVSSGVCSSKFTTCSNGRPEVFDCSAGLVFASSISACEYPQFVPGCPQFDEISLPTLTPPTPSSYSSSTYSPPISDAVIVDDSISEYNRDEMHSTTTRRPILPIKIGEHTSAKFEATGDVCTFSPKQPAFPLNYCSMTYAVCTADGMAYMTNCTFGYLFDSVIRQCVPSEHCGQPYMKEIGGSSPPSFSPIQSMNHLSHDSRCVGVKDGTFKATSLCSGQYIRCEKESVMLVSCPSTAHVFSPLTGRCVLRVQMAECSSSPKAGSAPAITLPKTPSPSPSPSSDSISSSTYSPPSYPSPSHRGSRIRGGLSFSSSSTPFDASSFCTTKHSDGLYRHPENCAGIIQCFGGEVFSYPSCAPGLFFNEIDSQCDYASNVPECASQSDPISLEDSFGSCKGQPHGSHLADDSNCSIYYRCVWGSMERLTCPDGTVFNPRLSVCDYPSEVPHCQKQ